MNHPLAVCRGQRIGNLRCGDECLLRRHRPLQETRGQCLACDMLHHEKHQAPVIADVVQRADVGMIQGATAFASRSNRERRSASSAMPCGSTLIATVRSRRVSLAL